MVDYLQLVRTEKNYQSRQQQIAFISRSLKLLAQRLNAPILAVSQLNKSIDYREGSKSGGRPKLGSLREASDIENDASKVFAIWGGSDTGTRVLVCLKNRQGLAGKVADIVFNWEPAFSRYYTDGQKQISPQDPSVYQKISSAPDPDQEEEPEEQPEFSLGFPEEETSKENNNDKIPF